MYFSYDSSDGTSRTEEGAILNPGTPDAALNVLGTVRWYDDKGQLYEMSYKGAAAAADSIDKPEVEILTEKSNISETGYDFEFKTSDGVSRKEEGQLITVGEHQGIGVRGSYSYNAPDGQQYIVTFVADDKGFKPTIRVADPQ
ncbi:Endocuticle structural glycoprotein SgAbd-5 [Papilio xuthus]|uniref:Endocuticle structural glycoprotein SgAbd-5 n=1 Tax=Papilio xuthus TaxID=66420 RepID=A0A194PX40_PAPXU|nr:Endocuticle structural glycoprotein SgAbd-5 [Papilio xuthus]